MECFTTAGLPARRKLTYWNEVSTETFTALEVVPGDASHFDGRLYRDTTGPVGLADVTTAPGVLRHTRAHIARGLGERFTLLVALEGGFEFRWGSQPGARVGVGDLCLLDQSRPYELCFHEVSRTFCFVLPQRYLGDFLPDPEAFAGRVLHPAASSARVLVQLTKALSAELEQGQAASFAPQFGRGLGGFIAAAFSRERDGEVDTRHAARRRRVLQHIEDQLHDPDLRPAGIARHFGISERTLRLLFASQDESLTAYVLRRRLESCSLLLRDPAWRDRTITDIALRHGFNNPTHFGHAFKQRFGLTPREYRQTPLNPRADVAGLSPSVRRSTISTR
jgi:AraC-like DNA-binding protein